MSPEKLSKHDAYNLSPHDIIGNAWWYCYEKNRFNSGAYFFYSIFFTAANIFPS
jgi:hypothetical protein